MFTLLPLPDFKLRHLQMKSRKYVLLVIPLPECYTQLVTRRHQGNRPDCSRVLWSNTSPLMPGLQCCCCYSWDSYLPRDGELEGGGGGSCSQSGGGQPEGESGLS